ncbi:hypothetical protein [Allosalinactinospora lopnorensis]|uniref:hypothetical protein n=1 Tax=Allosalinactinospora lopnorensis TaxID=1352348 RepID=UPI000623C9D3|nr:hypothetical protein [Allosalinactinospora lopnorensis]
MTTYNVTVTHEDDLWVAVIGGLPKGTVGASDYVRFADLRDDLPELIADLTGSDPDELAITWRYEFGGHDVTTEIGDLLAAEERLRESHEERDQARRAALAAMKAAGLSQRTMADVVELSHQRVNQLLKAS